MPLLQETAELLSGNDIARGIIEEIIYRDDMFNLLPFTPVTGKALVYDREDGPAVEADWLNPNDTFNEGGASFKEVVAKLRILGGDVDVDKFLDGTMSDRMSQKAVQIAAKLKTVRAQFQRQVADGNTAVNEKGFDGLPALVSPDMIIDAGGKALTFSMLDELRDAIKLGADCFVMRSGTWRAIKQMLRATNGNTAELLIQANFGMTMRSFDGMPVVINDFLSKKEGPNQNTCSIYAVRMNEVDGLHGIYAAGLPAGIQVEDVGTVQNKDAERTRVKWYAGLALRSTRSLARISGLTNV